MYEVIINQPNTCVKVSRDGRIINGCAGKPEFCFEMARRWAIKLGVTVLKK